MTSPYHIIGDSDTVLGFSFAGVPGDVVASHEEALKAFNEALKKPGLVVLVLTEAVEDMLDKEVTAHKFAAKKPYIATVEDIWGTRQGHKTLEQLISEAVGVKLI